MQFGFVKFTAVALFSHIAHAQPCDEGSWSRSFPTAEVFSSDNDGPYPVRGLAIFGDPSRLHIGGKFEFAASDTWSRHLAVWNGQLWDRLGGLDPNQPVNTFLTWDDPKDPAGPALYVAGEFSRIGEEVIRRVGKWDGKTWAPLASGLRDGPLGATVRAMVIHDDGTGPALYAAGYFGMSGDEQTPLAHIARWDGQAWHNVGGGFATDQGGYWASEGVYSLASFDDGTGPALYAAGNFIGAGGKVIKALAKWDGKEWAAPQVPVEPPSTCPDCEFGLSLLAVHDDGTGPALWAAGFFHAPGVPVDFLGRYRNGQWEYAGEVLANNQYAHDQHFFEAFVVHDDGAGPALYLGGMFEVQPPEEEDRGGCLVRWDADTQAWVDLMGNPTIEALASQNDQTGRRLWVGGFFGQMGGEPATSVASLSDQGWERVGERAPRSDTHAVEVFDDGSGPAIYVAGSFRTIGDLGWCHGIARYGSDGWSTVGDWADIKGAEEANLFNLAVLDAGDGPKLYAHADLRKGNKVIFDGIVRWDGLHWATVGDEGFKGNGSPFVYDDGSGRRIYLLSGAQDIAVYRLEDGQWKVWVEGERGDGGGMNATVEFDDGSGPALWMGGDFVELGGQPCARIARYRSGQGWEPVGAGMDERVRSLVVWDDGTGAALYASGTFRTANGVVVNRVARWDPGAATWLPLGKGLAGGINGVGSAALHPWDDGSGPSLYAIGLFGTAGGEPIKYIAKWDGKEWSGLGEGVDGPVNDAVGFDAGEGPALYVTGSFAYAGGYPSPGIAGWIPCPPVPCPADLDGSGSLDLFDFLTFFNLLNAGDAGADCDGDGSVAPADFACYSALFAEGCP
jgi:trimeric autotransporter adhesin